MNITCRIISNYSNEIQVQKNVKVETSSKKIFARAGVIIPAKETDQLYT